MPGNMTYTKVPSTEPTKVAKYGLSPEITLTTPLKIKNENITMVLPIIASTRFLAWCHCIQDCISTTRLIGLCTEIAFYHRKFVFCA